MKKRIGMYPRVRPDVAGSGLVCQAGGITLVATIRASGLGQRAGPAVERGVGDLAQADRGP